MTVDGREARIQIADAGDTLCDGADFGASVAIDIDELWTDHIELCTRGVEPVVALDAFRRFVLSIDLAPFN